jgi:transketolase
MVKLEKQIIAKEKSLAKKIVDCKQANEKQQWRYLFTALEQGVVSEAGFTEQGEYQHLNTFWQKKLKELTNKEQLANRAEATLELEILSGIPSPSELQQSRMAVQVNLMQTQMSSGAPIDLEDKFSQWLMLGKFDQQDIAFLNRVKPIFQ